MRPLEPEGSSIGKSAIDPRVEVDMPVRAGGGERLGHVEAVDERGIHLGGGLVAPWSDLIEVREGEVFVSGHRPDIGERVEESPRH